MFSPILESWSSLGRLLLEVSNFLNQCLTISQSPEFTILYPYNIYKFPTALDGRNTWLYWTVHVRMLKWALVKQFIHPLGKTNIKYLPRASSTTNHVPRSCKTKLCVYMWPQTLTNGQESYRAFDFLQAHFKGGGQNTNLQFMDYPYGLPLKWTTPLKFNHEG